MKINFPSLFQTPLQKVTIFFIFGNDPVVFERAISFLQKKLASPLRIKTEDDLLTNGSSQPSLFADKASSSLTLVSHVTDKIIKVADSLTEGPYIFISEKARAQSKLVTYFSQSSTSLAIASYASPLISSEFEFLVGEMNLPVSFKGCLFKAYQNDYMGLLSTLEKIKLHGDVSEKDYEAFLTPFSSSEFSSLTYAFLVRQLEKATSLFSCINSSDEIPLLRHLSRSFQILSELMPFKKSPKSISWQTLTPPVFFKDQPFYEAALSRWEPQEVHIFLEALLTLEVQVKFSNLPLTCLKQKLSSFLS